MNKKRLYVSLLASGLLTLVPAMAQDVVKLTTNKASGQTLSVELNQLKKGATVDWGDGVAVAVEPTDGATLLISGELKGSEVTITTDSKLRTLICAEQEITALDLTGAPNLTSLYCQGNELSQLDLSSNYNLADLNCANNKIANLTLTDETHPMLENINLSGNKMRNNTGGSGLAFTLRSNTLQHADISGNMFTSVVLTSTDSNLEVLDCSNNKLNNLDLSKQNALTVIKCQDNNLSSLKVPAEATQLRQLFAMNNKLSKLDISTAPELNYLAVDNNALTSVVMPTDRSFKLYAYTCGGNKLSFNSLPRLSAVENVRYMPQVEDIDIKSSLKYHSSTGKRYILVCPEGGDQHHKNYVVSMRSLMMDGNGNKASVTVTPIAKKTYTDDFAELASNTDYKLFSVSTYFGEFVFLNPQDEVYFKLSSKNWPELVQTTTHFTVVNDVKDITGIEGVTVNSGLNIEPAQGALYISGQPGTPVRVYNAAGKLMWQGVSAAGETRVELPAGVYIVNGQKVVL